MMKIKRKYYVTPFVHKMHVDIVGIMAGSGSETEGLDDGGKLNPETGGTTTSSGSSKMTSQPFFEDENY